jgi:hypothetical protein
MKKWNYVFLLSLIFLPAIGVVADENVKAKDSSGVTKGIVLPQGYRPLSEPSQNPYFDKKLKAEVFKSLVACEKNDVCVPVFADHRLCAAACTKIAVNASKKKETDKQVKLTGGCLPEPVCSDSDRSCQAS